MIRSNSFGSGLRMAMPVALVVLTLAAPVSAGESLGPPAVEEYRAWLELTDEQVERVRPIFVAHLETHRATLERYGVADGGWDTVEFDRLRTLGEALRRNAAKTERKLSRVLSKAQMAEYGRVRAEQSERFREGMLSRYVDNIAAMLELTPEQAEWVRPVLMQHTGAQTAILDKYGIKPGGAGGGRLGLRGLRQLQEEMDANNSHTERQLSIILSESQMAAYESFQAEQRRRSRSRLLQR